MHLPFSAIDLALGTPTVSGMDYNNPFDAAVVLDDDTAAKTRSLTRSYLRTLTSKRPALGTLVIDHTAPRKVASEELAHIATELVDAGWETLVSHRGRSLREPRRSADGTEHFSERWLLLLRNPDVSYPGDGPSTLRRAAMSHPSSGCDSARQDRMTTDPQTSEWRAAVPQTLQMLRPLLSAVDAGDVRGAHGVFHSIVRSRAIDTLSSKWGHASHCDYASFSEICGDVDLLDEQNGLSQTRQMVESQMGRWLSKGIGRHPSEEGSRLMASQLIAAGVYRGSSLPEMVAALV